MPGQSFLRLAYFRTGLDAESLPRKGFDYPEAYALLRAFGFTEHIGSRGEEAQSLKRKAGYEARRWVVKRTHTRIGS
jgi:hypothetical protein